MDRRDFLKNLVATGATASGACAAIGLFAEGSPAVAGAAPLRPPGARDEDEFLARCLRCLRCVEACPNQALMPLDGSFGARKRSTPAIHARRQACMLCNRVDGEYLKCTEACPSGALELVRRDAAEIQQKVQIGKAEIDEDLCYSYNSWSCGACFRACPFPGRAMTLGMWERPEIHAEQCVGCGLCERACIRYPQAVRVRVV